VHTPALSFSGTELYAVDTTPKEYNTPYITSYVIVPEPRDPLIVVDPGPRCCIKPLISLLEELRGEERGIIVIVTHVHIDHAGSAGLIASKYNALVYVHPRGAPHLENTGKLWRASREYLGRIAEIYGEPERVPQELVKATRDGETIRLNALSLQILHTPGHASHHQSIIVEASERVLFPGDSAGIVHPLVDAVVPTTPPPLKLDRYIESLKRQMSLKPDKIAYTHTGVSKASMLDRHMRQIMLWEDTLKEKADISVDDALKLLYETDPETRAFVDAIANVSKLLMEALKHSIDGFLTYYRGAKAK